MPEMGYQVVRGATQREVLEHFLRTEVMRREYAEQREEIVGWIALDDEGFFRCMRQFADSRADVNPVLSWTIGTPGNRHHERVARWVLARVDIKSLYTCGINPMMKADLDAVQGNLARFSTVGHKYPEFRMDSLPDGGQAIIVGVARQSVGRDGTIEAVDGAHRIVAMAGREIQNTSAFLAELRAGE
jgi:hypothetical protein